MYYKSLWVETDIKTDNLSTHVRASSIEPEKPMMKMQNRKLVSSYVPLATHYCIGIIRDHQLYLVPVEGVLQMRPDFRSLDEHEDRRRNQTGGLSDEMSEEETTEIERMEHDDIKQDDKMRNGASRICEKTNTRSFSETD
jgi:hypothetical protein